VWQLIYEFYTALLGRASTNTSVIQLSFCTWKSPSPCILSYIETIDVLGHSFMALPSTEGFPNSQ